MKLSVQLASRISVLMVKSELRTKRKGRKVKPTLPMVLSYKTS